MLNLDKIGSNTLSVLYNFNSLESKDINEAKVKEIFKNVYPGIKDTDIPKIIISSIDKLLVDKPEANTLSAKMLSGALKALSYLEKVDFKGKNSNQLTHLHKKLNNSIESVNNAMDKTIDPDALKSELQEQFHTLLGSHGRHLEAEMLLFLFMQTNADPKSQFTKTLREFISECIKSKTENLVELSKDDGNVGRYNEKAMELHQRLLTELGMANVLERQVLGKQNKVISPVEGYETIISFLKTMLMHALPYDIQINSDTLGMVLPPNMSKTLCPEERVYRTNSEIADEYTQAESAIKQSSLSPHEKRERIGKLKFERGYSLTQGTIGYQMEKWESVVRSPDLPFEQGRRVIGYMTPDRQEKNEDCEVLLDLRDLKLTHPNQDQQIFSLINSIVQAENKDPDLFKKWFAMRNNNPPPSIAEISTLFTGNNDDTIDLISKLAKVPANEMLTKEQMQMALGKALDFSYRILHDMRQNYLELSTRP